MGHDETARIETWNGATPPTCDNRDCDERPVVALEVAPILPAGTGGEYRAFVQVCERHLDDLKPLTRALLVINRCIEPADPTEQNLLTVLQEHET